ncbi:Cfap58, partial [Symbiodinium pilosum]
ASAFEALERDFQEILQELVGDKSLEHFRNEYEKLHRALKKSHESEKHLIKKCRELNAEIVQNAVKVQTALKLSQEDQATITALKKEIERAWKMVEASHEKEQRARETIQNLKSEITKLGRLVEQGAGLSINQENMVNQLVQEKNDLVKHRDMLQGQVQQMQQQNTDLTAKVAKLEQEADRQQKRKEKLDKDSACIAPDLRFKSQERSSLKRICVEDATGNMQEKQKHLQRLLREERQEEERLTIRAAQLKGNYEHLIKQHKEEQQTLARLKDEQADYKAKVKFRQDEIHALKSSKQKLAKSLEALQTLKDKDDAESRRLEAKTTDYRGQVKKLQEDLDKQKQDSEAHEKQITDLLHERDILGKALMKGDERSKQQAELVELHKGQAITLSKDLHRWKTELHLKLERIHELDRQREKYATDLQQAKQRCEAAHEELRGREVQMAQLKRSIADVRAKWAQQKNLYEAVRTDKNLYSKNLVESLEEITEMRKKFKVMCHQIEQLKEEIKEKAPRPNTNTEGSGYWSDLVRFDRASPPPRTCQDQAMIHEHFKHQNISKETEKTKHTLEYHEKQQTKSQQVVEQQQSDIKKLEADRAETVRAFLALRYHQAVTSERNILGKQLIRRNEELTLIYEKIKIQESTLNKGEAQYKKLLDSLRGQRDNIGTQGSKRLKRDLYIARQQARSPGDDRALDKFLAESAEGLEKEVYHLQRELLQERTKVRALSEELENPMNVHRWRKLEGSDPAIYELIQKVRTLQKRLIAKTEEVVAKDTEIQEKEKLHKELTSILEKQPGPEVLEQLEQYQETYNAKLKQMKAMQSELHTYQSQVSDYKDEIDRLNRELAEVKKKFFEQKKREMMAQDAQRGDGRVIHPRPVPQVRYMGGLFSLSH